MKKIISLAALAVAAFAASAHADSANVNVYGTFNFSFEASKIVGGSAADRIHRFRLLSNSSNFGFKGTEDLGDGFKAIWQIESGIDPFGSSTLANRNTGLGLGTGIGTFLAGQWDTPYKTAALFMEPFYGAGVGFMQSLLDTSGGNVKSTTFVGTTGTTAISDSSNFSRRQGNTIQYWSPTFMGTTLKAMYMPNFNRTPTNTPGLYSLSATYEEGPINAALAYEIHQNFTATTATNPSNKDTGLKLAVGFKPMETTKLGFTWTNLGNNVKTLVGTEEKATTASKNAFGLSATHAMNALTLRLGAVLASSISCGQVLGEDCTQAQKDAYNDTGAKQVMVGGSYTLSKRTDVYAEYSQIWNSAKATYNFILGNSGTVNAGADPQSFALGVRHTF